MVESAYAPVICPGQLSEARLHGARSLKPHDCCLPATTWQELYNSISETSRKKSYLTNRKAHRLKNAKVSHSHSIATVTAECSAAPALQVSQGFFCPHHVCFPLRLYPRSYRYVILCMPPFRSFEKGTTVVQTSGFRHRLTRISAWARFRGRGYRARHCISNQVRCGTLCVCTGMGSPSRKHTASLVAAYRPPAQRPAVEHRCCKASKTMLVSRHTHSWAGSKVMNRSMTHQGMVTNHVPAMISRRFKLF